MRCSWIIWIGRYWPDAHPYPANGLGPKQRAINTATHNFLVLVTYKHESPITKTQGAITDDNASFSTDITNENYEVLLLLNTIAIKKNQSKVYWKAFLSFNGGSNFIPKLKQHGNFFRLNPYLGNHNNACIWKVFLSRNKRVWLASFKI